MKKQKIIYIFLCIILLEFIVLRMHDLITDENYYGWPAVTQCRICNKTVWAWQNYERREFTVNNTGNFIEMSASGLVHKHCKGNPIFECEVYLK
jgi:hypothetical protein